MTDASSGPAGGSPTDDLFVFRDDIGALAPGMAADFAAFDLRTIGYAGAHHDPVAALLFCTPTTVNWSAINGRIVVRDGHLATLDLPVLLEKHRAFARALATR